MAEGAQKKRTRTGWQRLRKLLRLGAMPLMVASLVVLLLCGAFARAQGTAHLVAWAFLLQACALAGVRRLRRVPNSPAPARESAEEGILLAVAVLALAQASGGVSSPLYALLYLLGAAFVLAHPLRLALGLLAFALTLDGALLGISGALPEQWPNLLAHVGFTSLFAALYHALLAARLRAAKAAEERAVAE